MIRLWNTVSDYIHKSDKYRRTEIGPDVSSLVTIKADIWFITSDEKKRIPLDPSRSFRQQAYLSLFLISLDDEKMNYSETYVPFFSFQTLSFTCFDYLYLSALIQVVVFYLF